MAVSELVFIHRVDKAFLTSGCVLPRKDFQKHSDYVQKAIDNHQEICIIFEGEKHSASFDNVRKGLYRLMFRTSLQAAFQKKFAECYDSDSENKTIVTKAEVVINVGFYFTDEEYTLEAKQIGDTMNVDPDVMRSAYQEYLSQLDGKFQGYVQAVSKKLVNEVVKDSFGLPSAYYITSANDVIELVNIIRTDKILDQKDIDTSNRVCSCSLKKYAEFLAVYTKHSTRKPFEVSTVIDTISNTGLIFDSMFVKRYLCALLTKPFVILSGLTGSGKTQLALAFPKLICKDKSQYRMIPVGADWTNRENLLGYPNALRPNEYVMPDNGALELILEASKPENADKPYFLILDEMNMSYVERYFADFLSAMESGEAIPLWVGNATVPASVTLPPNLFIVGTINVDETTYMFSPKVLDRANVIEFRIKKDQMEAYLNGSGALSPIEDCSEQAASFIEIALKDHVSPLSDEMKKTLVDTFETLGKIQKEFGYRTAHEMSRFISIAKNYTDMSDMEALDSAMVQKLLPKIHGSRKKVTPVLKALWNICYASTPIEIDALPELPDLNVFNYPLTAEKVWRMFQIAQDNGFTSFAEA